MQRGNDTIRIEVLDEIGVLTFTRPASRNAIHDDMFEPMFAAIDEWSASHEVGCIVITGEGSAFCAGGDVRVGSGRRQDGSKPSPDQRAEFLTANAQICVALNEAPIVSIAAINGPAVGAGMAIALACDLRIAASSARFIGGWAALGFSGDYGGAWLLANRVGASTALDIVATNRTIGADEALRIGLVDRLAPDDGFDAAWREWAATYAAGPRAAIGSMKANISDAGRLTLADAIAVESQRMIASAQTDDHREGVRAWVEKRPPRFGRRA